MLDNNLLLKYPDAFFPASYLVIDIETTGLDNAVDFIAQLGMTHVINGVPANKVGFYVHVPKGSMTKRAQEIHHISEEDCNTKGVPRNQALPLLAQTLQGWRGQGGKVVGHNAARFDLPFISSLMSRENVDFDFADDDLVDTGCLVKALQLNTWPRSHETPRMFWNRISEIRAKGVFWNLDRFCFAEFQLADKVKAENLTAHDALSDTLMTSWVLEGLKARRELVKAAATAR